MALYTYPSNKLEYLVQILSKLLDVEQKGIFTPTQLIVGSRGMQHWLSMQLAENRNIAMNLKFDMVNGYILDICYELTGKQEYKKAYTKDILTWRVFKILSLESNSEILNNPSTPLRDLVQDDNQKLSRLATQSAPSYQRGITTNNNVIPDSDPESLKNRDDNLSGEIPHFDRFSDRVQDDISGGQNDREYNKLKEYYKDSDLKKYQLSVKIAETFSKYLSYRTEWLQKWQKGEYINLEKPEADESWQMLLWQKLVEQVPDTPYRVQSEAIAKLNARSLKNIKIPNNIYIFGVNTISPKNLNFLFELAKYIDVNILYINPCSEYWYDLQKDKISAWLGSDDYELQPLLANLGQQGKEFFNKLLDNEEKQELEVFEKFDRDSLTFEKLQENNQSQLVSLQRNLLELDCQNHTKQKDSSISINSCHSPLREVQVLHDKLLDMIKADPSIKPRDILVMCPNIEDYSPYIDSVFSRYGEDKKLVCSIADRTLLDSESLAASFIELLQLPESDFEVNKILDYLSVPAIQQKFNISDEQLETIRYWLAQTCIHHGNDGKIFSWSWGLKRLMLGFGYGDNSEILNHSSTPLRDLVQDDNQKLPRLATQSTPSYQRGIITNNNVIPDSDPESSNLNGKAPNQLLTVPIIEGSEIAELGGLYELLELLAEYSQHLLEPRSFEQWRSYLLEMFDNVFDITNDEQYIAKKIKDIIAKTVEIAKEIVGDTAIDLYTIRYCLITQLSEPIINNHFLNGKVTFCSMTPMRNVPFKVVAMLGLNNGKFPRQENMISFDIMARLGREKGDRTKRDDDRYLFLEAILSARKYLYFSYIGRSVKNNTEQQPSLILKELISYLKTNYAWGESDIKEYPLHAFSPKCYLDDYRSYDEAWLKLLQAKPKPFYGFNKTTPSCLRNPPLHEAKGNIYSSVISDSDRESLNLSIDSKLPKNLTISKLVKFFDNPLKAYANYSLGLYLEDSVEELEDSEPFDIDNLEKHGLKEQLFENIAQQKETKMIEKTSKLSGKFPESIITDQAIAEQIENMQNLVDISEIQNQEKQYFRINIADVELETSCYIGADNQIKLTTVSRFKIKHKLELYLTALLVSYSEQKDITATYYYLEDGKEAQREINISYTQAKQQLEHYITCAKQILEKPTLIHLLLAEALFADGESRGEKYKKSDKQKQEDWQNVVKSSKHSFDFLEDDKYFNLFYNEYPIIEDFEGESVYRDFFEVLNK